MTFFWNRKTRKHTRTTSIALTMAASVLGSAGCSGPAELEGEEVAEVRSALGSTLDQVTVDDWTELTQMASNGNYLLTVNLNALGKTWTPKNFTGTFDGGGKTISNLSINGGGSGGGFFKNATNAIVRNVRFTSLSVTDSYAAGGVAATADNSLIEQVGVQGNISGPGAFVAGGIIGMGYGTNILSSFMKGTVSGGLFGTGGIAGSLGNGATRGLIEKVYAWADVTTTVPAGTTYAKTGGIVGQLGGAFVKQVYAVGKITGRAQVGGLVGSLECNTDSRFILNHGIFRGDVIDQDWTAAGGWAGTYGEVQPCPDRFDQNIWDSSRDPSTNFGVYDPPAQKSASNNQLILPTTVSGGVYNYADNKFITETWDAGSSTQHHALKNMPGGLLIQPRCVNASGVAYAC
jgi:hypothetical protein